MFFFAGNSIEAKNSSSGGDSEHELNNETEEHSKGLVAALSFEFLSASCFENRNTSSVSQSADVENKENIPPVNEKNLNPPSVKLKKKYLDSDKENIPPVTNNQIKTIDENMSKDIIDSISDRNSSILSADSLFGNITNIDIDLQKGISLLNSLIEAKKLDKITKKKLVKKIVHRLLKAKYNETLQQTTSSTKSNSNPLTSDSSSKNSSLGKNIVAVSGVNTLSGESSETAPSTVKPAPMNLKRSLSVRKPSSEQQLVVLPILSPENSELTVKSTSPQDLNNQSMKDWLEPMTHSEINYEKRKTEEEMKQNNIEVKQNEMQKRLLRAQDEVLNKNINDQCDSNQPDNFLGENLLKFVRKERNSQLDWIQKEINHLVNLKEFLVGEKKKREMDIMQNLTEKLKNNLDISSGDSEKRQTPQYENIKTNSRNSQSGYALSQIDKTTSYSSRISGNISVARSIPKASGQVPTKSNYFKEPEEPSRRKEIIDSSSEWDSHLNMQKLLRNRTKLNTPNEIDLGLYARAKQQDFVEKYQTKHGKLYEDRLLYTQPYSTDHYSEPREIRRTILPTKKPTTDAYTSITSSDLFLSSNSVSVPIGNSTSNSTTHQYDNHASVYIQTTDSLKNMAPIFIDKTTGATYQPTRRVTKVQHDKQQQSIPESVAYTITFENKNQNESSMKERYYNIPQKIDKNNGDPYNEHLINNLSTLQQQLQTQRPEFLSKAEARRNCLNEINNLRQKRNEQRQKLFLLSSTNNSLRSNMKYLNPTPIQMKRIFTTKHLQRASKLRYKQLPEIRRKEEIERQNKIKRSNRIVTDMFNRDLQKRVLRGNINLSNSMTVSQ